MYYIASEKEMKKKFTFETPLLVFFTLTLFCCQMRLSIHSQHMPAMLIIFQLSNVGIINSSFPNHSRIMIQHFAQQTFNGHAMGKYSCSYIADNCPLIAP